MMTTGFSMTFLDTRQRKNSGTGRTATEPIQNLLASASWWSSSDKVPRRAQNTHSKRSSGGHWFALVGAQIHELAPCLRLPLRLSTSEKIKNLRRVDVQRGLEWREGELPLHALLLRGGDANTWGDGLDGEADGGEDGVGWTGG